MVYEKKTIHKSSVIKVKHIHEESMHVLRGSFRDVPTVEEIQELVDDVKSYISQGDQEFAVFFDTNMENNDPLELKHLLCIMSNALQNRSMIQKHIRGTKLLLGAPMSTTFRAVVTLFQQMYTPVKPFLITDSVADSIAFEEKLRNGR